MARRLRLLPFMWFMILSLALPPTAHSQEIIANWRPLPGLGGRVTKLAASADGEVIYAVTVAEVNRREDQTQWLETGTPSRADALYLSTDRGSTWRPITNDLPRAAINALCVDRSGVLWVGLEHRGTEIGDRGTLWRSPDRGASWQRSRLDRGDLIIRSVTEDAGGGLLLGATASGELTESLVYRSADGGANWSSKAIPQDDERPGDTLAGLAAHPEEPGHLFVSMQMGGLLRSTDGGESWTNGGTTTTVSGSGPAQFVILPDSPSTALLVRGEADDLHVARSTDAGETWAETRATGLPKGALTVRALVALANDVVILNTDAGTYRSTDAGTTWQALEGVLDSGHVHDFLALSGGGSEVVLAATDYGLFASRNGGALWGFEGAGLPGNSSVAGILSHPARPEQLVVLARAVESTSAMVLLISRDSGASWLPASIGGSSYGATAWTTDPANPDIIYTAGTNYAGRTADGGLTWNLETLPSAGRSTIIVAPSNAERIYVDGAAGASSTNSGATWVPMTPVDGGETLYGLAVDPGDEDHLWAGTGTGVVESLDAGNSWTRAGLDGQAVRRLTATGGGDTGAPLTLFAGIQNGGLMRWRSTTQDWQPARTGLPSESNIIALVADARTPGLLWAARDGGGIYRSSDDGDSWQNAGVGVGDNLGLSLAVDYAMPERLWMGTATAGLWSLGANAPAPVATRTPVGAPTSTPDGRRGRAGADARIEVVWPHNFASLDQARLANVGIRLFVPESLEPPSCGWRPRVRLWRAVDTNPAVPVKNAEQRTVDGQPFPYWEANDVDVSAAATGDRKIYFLVQVEGVDTASSVWAHATDARTYFPEQLVPSGVATGDLDELDARIQIVWPHDENGIEREAGTATLANVAVTLFKHNTRLSVGRDWRPAGITLYGAWNAEVARPLTSEATVSVRQSGAITYPVWEFSNVPVARATDGASKLYMWVEVQGVQSYPTIWAHGLDSRTFFPAQDEPIQGCLP